MPDKRVPDPTLMARLQLSVKGVDWAASLVRHRQHEQPGGAWSAHQHVWHLLVTEREVYQPRLQRLLSEDRPVLAWWDENGHTRERLAELIERVGLTTFLKAVGLPPSPHMIFRPRSNPFVFFR